MTLSTPEPAGLMEAVDLAALEAVIPPVDTWPAVPMDERGALPSISGVYVVRSQAHHVLYVGQARNLRSRWRNHHRVWTVPHTAEIAFYPINTKWLRDVERDLIAVLKPEQNAHRVDDLAANALTLADVTALRDEYAKAAREAQVKADYLRQVETWMRSAGCSISDSTTVQDVYAAVTNGSKA